MQKHPARREALDGPEERARTADQSPCHGCQVTIFALLQSMHGLAERRALVGLKSGFVVELDWSSCEVEPVEASRVTAMAAKRQGMEPFSC